MHYEVELREFAYAADDDGVLRVTGSTWNTIKILRADADPMPLTFASLEEARAYAARDKRVRVVRVADDGTRELV